MKNTEKKVNEINQLNEKIIKLENEIKCKDAHIQQLIVSERELKSNLQIICNSKSYRITAPLRYAFKFFKKIYKSIIPVNCRKGIRILKQEGIKSLLYKIRQKLIYKAQLKKGEKKKLKILSNTSYNAKKIPQFENPMVSIIIPVFNQFDYTYKCIVSILNTVNNIPFEIIIGDDKSTDQTKDIKKYFPNIKVNINKTDHGFLMNCNRAAKLASGKYILFLNNDTQVQENWLSSLLTLIESDPEIGMVGSKLVYPDGRLQEAGGIIWNDGNGWNYGNGHNQDMPEYNYVKEVDYISGASIMIKKSLWDDIKGFDERYKPAYYEDVDLAFEVRKRCYKVMYQPASLVVHFEGISNGTDCNTGLKKYQIVNQKKFVEKWNNELKKQYPPDPEKWLFNARDRSFSKKRILVIDHYVPNFDKDAGGRGTYMYLQIFKKMGLQVSFIGDNFAKPQPYTDIITQKGIEILYGGWYSLNWENWLKQNLKYFDYVYLQRPHISIKYIDLIKENFSGKIFYYAVDLHYIRLHREYELTGNLQKLQDSEYWKKIEMELFSKADVGHVVGSYEQKVMKKIFPNKPIRNIPLYTYEKQLENVNKDFSKRNDLIFVGGFTHTPNLDAVLWFSKEIFPKILKMHPNIVWHIAGSNVPAEVKNLASKNISIEGFVSDEKLHSLYQECRLAIVPLRYGAGVKGKVIEAAYNQIPLITTSIGAEGLDGEVGSFLVENDADKLADLVNSTYDNYELLRKMSDCGRKFIEKYFTPEKALEILLEDMNY